MKVKSIMCLGVVVLLSMSISACKSEKDVSSSLVRTASVLTTNNVITNTPFLNSTPTPTPKEIKSPFSTVNSDNNITPKMDETTSANIVEPSRTPDCSIASTELPINAFNTHFITSVPTNPQVTQFNAFDNYVYYDVYINDNRSQSLSGDYYLLSNDNDQCILFPFLKIVKDFGASIVSTDDSTFIIQYEKNTLILNLSDSTLINYSDGTNCIIQAPDSDIIILKTYNDLYLDSKTLNSSLYIIGIKLIIHDDPASNAIYIWIDN